jgi:hypothetical protein
MHRFGIPLFLVGLTLLTGCDAAPSLIGTWDGEMPEGQAVKTAKGDFRVNLVLELRADHSFNATITNAKLDGTWEQQGQQVVLHLGKATVNGQDLEALKKRLAPMMPMLPAVKRAELEAYDPSKPWNLDIRDGGKNLYLPSRAEGMTPFIFHKAM